MSKRAFFSVLFKFTQFQRLQTKAYEEGLLAGQKAGHERGFDMGYRHGFEIHKKIGSIHGQSSALLTILPKMTLSDAVKARQVPFYVYNNPYTLLSRAEKILQELVVLCKSAPLDNANKEFDIEKLLAQITSKHRLAMVMLKLNKSDSQD